MNINEYYKAEIDYRREQVLRGRQPIRFWRRNRPATPAQSGPAAC